MPETVPSMLDDDATGTAPRHPRLARRSLIAWPGYHSGLEPRMLNRPAVGAIALPLRNAVHDHRFVSDSLKAGLGVVLPSQSWCNQLPFDHPKRAGAFSSLRLHRPGWIYEPGAARLAGSFLEQYAFDDLSAQLEAGATLALTPGHVQSFECADGRDEELLLARLSAAEFAQRRGAAPAPGQSHGRELYATIIVRGQHAGVPWMIERLIALYAELEGISGYWIIACNTTNSAAQMRGYARLALRLQELTDRPAVLSGISDEHLAALACGVAATCAGLHGMSFKFPPDIVRNGDAEDDEEEKGIGLYTYHRGVLGNAGALGEKGDAIRRRLFEEHGCPCGFHEANTPPRGKREIAAHNSFAVAADAVEFALPVVDVARARLALRAESASLRRRQFGLTRLRAGFRGIPIEAAELRGDAGSAAG